MNRVRSPVATLSASVRTERARGHSSGSTSASLVARPPIGINVERRLIAHVHRAESGTAERRNRFPGDLRPSENIHQPCEKVGGQPTPLLTDADDGASDGLAG